jgi:RNA polymerase sigma-70 factor (ECF subfamily)
MGGEALLDAFREGLASEQRAAFVGDAAFAQQIADAHACGQQAWPSVALAEATFARELGARLGAEPGDLSTLAREDLYLACALSMGDNAAIKVLERELFPQIVAVLARRGLARDGIDDLAQRLREHLLVGTATRPGRIADFRGRGSLRAWIVVAAVRMSDRAEQSQRRTASQQLVSVADPRLGEVEDDLAKERYREQLEQACERALVELPKRERALLRMHLVDGASIDQIGRIYGVHRATAARWLARARAAILAATQQRLAAELGVETDVAADIAELVQSQLDISVVRLLQTVPE